MVSKVKKISILLIVLLFYNYSFPWDSSDPEKLIVIVKPNIHANTKAAIQQIGSMIEVIGIAQNNSSVLQIGKGLKDMVDSGHGSGFIYVDSDGNNFIITNSHVIETAQTTTLQFKDGRTFSDAKIIYDDPDIDVAVLEFKNGEKEFSKGFEFTEDFKDNDEVYAVGFPGSPPQWSFSRGTITNKEVTVDERKYIKHSSPIDPGNSGGPLLIKEGIIFKSYSVIGMNTMYAKDKQLNNFSISTKRIKEVLERAQKIKKMKQNEISDLCASQSMNLANDLSSRQPDFQNLTKYIAYGFIGTHGLETFSDLGALPANLQQQLMQYVILNPIEGFKTILFMRLYTDIQLDRKGIATVKYDRIRNNSSVQDKIKTIFLIQSTPAVQREIEWVFEHGQCRISNLIGMRNFSEVINTLPSQTVSQLQNLDQKTVDSIMNVCYSTSANQEDLKKCVFVGLMSACKNGNQADEIIQGCFNNSMPLVDRWVAARKKSGK